LENIYFLSKNIVENERHKIKGILKFRKLVFILKNILKNI